MLTLPLVDHRGRAGRRDAGAEQASTASSTPTTSSSPTALAAQCAVALQRVRMTEALIEGEKMRQELEMARVVQMSTLPADDAGASPATTCTARSGPPT